VKIMKAKKRFKKLMIGIWLVPNKR